MHGRNPDADTASASGIGNIASMGPISVWITASVDRQEIDNVLECVARKAGIAKPPVVGGEVHVPSDENDAFASALHSCDPERLIAPS
jgi:hypothetical protein